MSIQATREREREYKQNEHWESKGGEWAASGLRAKEYYNNREDYGKAGKSQDKQ